MHQSNDFNGYLHAHIPHLATARHGATADASPTAKMSDDAATAELSQATILIFAHHLGVDIDTEDALLYIAREALETMPDGWELGVSPEGDENAGIPYFFNVATGDSVWEHPLDAVYKQRVKDERAKRLAAKASRSSQKEATPIRGGGGAAKKGGDTSAASAAAAGAAKASTRETSPATSRTASAAMAFVNSGGKLNKSPGNDTAAAAAPGAASTAAPAHTPFVVKPVAPAPEYGVLSVVLDGAKFHAKHRAGYTVSCSVVVSDQPFSVLSDDPERVVAAFQPPATSPHHALLRRYAHGKAGKPQGGAPVAVQVQRDCPAVPLGPSTDEPPGVSPRTRCVFPPPQASQRSTVFTHTHTSFLPCATACSRRSRRPAASAPASSGASPRRARGGRSCRCPLTRPPSSPYVAPT